MFFAGGAFAVNNTLKLALGRKIVAQEEHLPSNCPTPFLLSPEVNTPGGSEGEFMQGQKIAARKPRPLRRFVPYLTPFLKDIAS